MYILQNAFRNILRNQGRNILIGASMFAIIIASVVALMINNTASGIIDDYKSRFGAEISLVPNMQKLRDQAIANSTGGVMRMTRPVIPSEQYIAFGDSEHLQGSIYSASVGVNSDAITAVDAELGGGSTVRGMGATAGTLYKMRMLGNKFEDFAEGLREIAEGRMPENQNEGIVSTELAELNNLSVGDTISLTSNLIDSNLGIYDVSYELTITGIYYDVTDEYAEGGLKNAMTNRRNEILTGYETVVEPMQPGLIGIEIMATYFLKDPDLLDAFAAEVYAKGLDPVFDVTTDEASYNKIVGPVEGLKSISITFMVIVLIFGGTIIALLASIAIRERKYEIGVLRAMGMKKHKVALGLWSEMLIITGLCLVAGIAAGTLVAQPVTNVLLERQVEAAEAATQIPSAGGIVMMGMGGTTANPNAKPLDNIDIALGLDTTLQIMGIALLLASLAGLTSISKIMQYEPIKILMERS